MVFGCDGNHSNVRALRFGPEGDYSHFLHNYFSVAVVGRHLHPTLDDADPEHARPTP